MTILKSDDGIKLNQNVFEMLYLKIIDFCNSFIRK